MRILVVDDDKIIRMGLSKKIKRLFNEHEVINNFQNGNNVLDYLKKNDAELVITDIKMPVMTGIELIEKAEKVLDKPPVFIVLSGYDDFGYVRDSMKHGAVNYLLKPVVEEELKKAVYEAEIEVKQKKKQDKIMKRSIDILRKDFFRYLLFNDKSGEKRDEKLLKNSYLKDDYIYIMMVINYRSDKISSQVNKFVNVIVSKYKRSNYTYYFYEDSVYLIFYYKYRQYNLESFQLDLNCESDIFIRNNFSIYMFDGTKEIWSLKENISLIKKFKSASENNIKAEKYFLKNSDDLSKILSQKKVDESKTSIKLAKEYIIKNYSKNISLKDVADEIFLSQNYLSELFKKETGEGFYEFLSNYRINKAKKILLTTNLKIYEIAERVGYSDSITFGRAFKKKTGKTPNSYRNDVLSTKEVSGNEG